MRKLAAAATAVLATAVAVGAAGYYVAFGVGETTGTVTAAVPDRVVTIPGTTAVVTYTTPTVTVTVTGTTPTPPPPPPPTPYPPTGLAVHRFWIGIFSADAFNYAADSTKFDDFIAHAADSWPNQGARFKQYQPNGHVLMYQDFGYASNGVSTVLTAADARSRGFLAHHNGAEIPNPWSGDPSQPVVDLGKPGVKEAYATALQQKLAANPWDGTFADDVNTWANLWSNGQGIDGYTGYVDWVNRAVIPLMQYVKANIRGELRPNLGDWPNQPSLDGVLPYTSGANNEWYLTYNNAATQSAAQIEREYASMRSAISQGKVYEGIVHRTDVQGLKFAFCAAAIMGGDHPELVRVANQQNYGSTALTWDASMTTQLGTPTNAVSHTTGSTAWSRSFSGGRTLTINTSAQTCTGI